MMKKGDLLLASTKHNNVLVPLISLTKHTKELGV